MWQTFSSNLPGKPGGRWVAWIVDGILPRHCVLCGQLSTDANLCDLCEADLPRTRYSCTLCGLPIATARDPVCGPCLTLAPPWSRVVSGLEYRHPADHLVRRFKFNRSLACGEILGSQLLRSIGQRQVEMPDVIIPVPLHRARHFIRSFNQADLLARQLASHFGIPVHSCFLRRVRRTRAQSGLDAANRRKNVKGAFCCRKPTGGAAINHAALVDDVMTTGETLADCTRALKAAGVRTVSIWIAARAPASQVNHPV